MKPRKASLVLISRVFAGWWLAVAIGLRLVIPLEEKAHYRVIVDALALTVITFLIGAAGYWLGKLLGKWNQGA